MRDALLVLGVILCCATSAGAQVSWVTLPDGGRVPCDHPLAVSAGLGCAAPACVTFGTATVCAPCLGRLDPYTEGDRAVACGQYAAAHAPLVVPRPPTVFEAGRIYQGPYPGQRFLVLGTTLALDGGVVVTAEWIGAGWNLSGTVKAFRAKDIDTLFEAVP